MGKMAAGLRMKMCKKTDDRLQLTQETLSAVKIIKIYTWEKFFNKKIAEARRYFLTNQSNLFEFHF